MNFSNYLLFKKSQEQNNHHRPSFSDQINSNTNENVNELRHIYHHKLNTFNPDDESEPIDYVLVYNNKTVFNTNNNASNTSKSNNFIKENENNAEKLRAKRPSKYLKTQMKTMFENYLKNLIINGLNLAIKVSE